MALSVADQLTMLAVWKNYLSAPGAANSTIFETADLDRQYFYWRGLRIQPLVAFNMAGMADQTCFFKVQLGQSAGRTRAIGFSWKIPFPPLLLTSEIQKYRNRDHKFKFRSFLLVFGLSSFSFYSLAENCISGNNGCWRIFSWVDISLPPGENYP